VVTVGRPGAYDVAVVGLGALGSAAAWQLTRRGLRVVGLERHALGHRLGASHGDSRIIRLSYHSPAYVRAAALAYAGWAELAAEAGEELVTPTGGADVFPAGAAIDFGTYTTSLDATGTDYELLDAAASRRRWPGLAVPDGAVVLHQPATGAVAADRGAAAMRRRALAQGAVLRDRAPVTGVREAGDGVELRTADGVAYRARHVVVAADAWTNDVLGMLAASSPGGDGPAPLPLTVTQEHVVHFAVDPGSYAPGRFPTWIWMDDPSYFGLPEYGEATVKVGRDCGGREIVPDGSRAPDPEYVGDLTAFVRATVPGAGPAVRVTPCLYTLTPDRDFVLGPVPGHERVLVALGAAHGFKFAPWFGRVLAELVTGEPPASPLGDYAPGRARLTTSGARAAERSWLV
jgi:sarcosine oxidase